MAFYPGWFDYASWAIGIPGAICLLVMLSEPAGRKRGYLKLSACLLIAIGFAFAATAGILFNLRAPTLHAQGELFFVSHHGGKGSHTDFALRVPTGEVYGLEISGDRSSIVEGELADVEYQQLSQRVLSIRIMDGPNTGYEGTAGNGFFGSCAALLGCIVLAGYGLLDWISDGTAIPSEKAEDSTAMSDGDVDTKSMLNLSQPD